jgi:hypothetical protein
MLNPAYPHENMNRLEKASNIAVIIAATVVAVTTIYGRLRPPAAGVATEQFAKQYTGKPLPLPGIQGAAVTTLVLFASVNCHYCAESVPFYRRLAELRSGSSGQLRLVTAFPQARQTADETARYFSEKGITLDAVEPIAFPAIGVNGTPTLALVDRSGTVKAVWVGKLSAEKEAEVLLQIHSMCRDCAVN